MDSFDLLTYGAALLIIRRRRKRRALRRASRKFWVRPIFLDRLETGAYASLISQMRFSERESFFRYLRMSPDRFDHLLSLVRERIQKQHKIRSPIPAEERLALTLRFLASGESKQSLSFSFKIGKSTVSAILDEVCDAIWSALSDYVKAPSSSEDWMSIAETFRNLWDMPNCIGAIDGKCIAIQAPSKSAPLSKNYKGCFNLILLAICDANYCFSLIDLGRYGSNNDSGILLNSLMWQRFREGSMNIPDASFLPGSQEASSPYFLVGDEVFPLEEWLMRPFAESINEERKIFNYRLSRARRVIENSFGILVARWKLFRRPIESAPEKVEKFTLAAIALHNYLRQSDTDMYTPFGFSDSEDSTGKIIEGEWRTIVPSEYGAVRNMPKVRNSRSNNSAIQQRQNLAEYFVTDTGKIAWQWDYVRNSGSDTNVNEKHKQKIIAPTDTKSVAGHDYSIPEEGAGGGG